MWFKPLQDLIGNIVDYAEDLESLREESSSSDHEQQEVERHQNIPMYLRDNDMFN